MKKEIFWIVFGIICIILLIIFIVYNRQITEWFFNNVLGSVFK